jgi:hypothetical protein
VEAEASTDDVLDLNVTQTLAEVTVDGDLRMVMHGDEPFVTGTVVASVVSLAPDVDQRDYAPGTAPDSRAQMRVPTLKLDDDTLYTIQVDVRRGASPVAIVSSDTPVHKDAVAAVVRRSAEELADDAKGDFSTATGVAQWIKNTAIRVLNSRIYAIEQTVRNALADEQLSEADYAALRDYPARFAIVENLSLDIRNPEPSWTPMTQPSAQSFLGPVTTPTVDFFFKHANEVETAAKEGVARMSNLISSQQVVMVQRQRIEVERFQRVVTLVGAAVLVPGLIAAIFGANVNFHGRDQTAGFWAMLLFMVAGGVGSYALLRSIELGMWSSVRERLRLRIPSERGQALILCLVAAVFAAAGALILWTS